MKFEDNVNRPFKIEEKLEDKLDSTVSQLYYVIQEEKGYTPTELMDIVDAIAEDQIEEQNRTFIFNRAITAISNNCNIKLPHITESLLETPYPSFKYDLIAEEPSTYLPGYHISTLVFENASYLKQIRLFRILPRLTDGTKPSTIKLKFVLEGGEISGSEEVKYLIEIKASFDEDGVLQYKSSIGEIFNIQKIADINNQLSFFVIPDIDGYYFYVSPTISIGDKFNPISLKLVEVYIDNIDLYIGYKKFIEIVPGTTPVMGAFTYPLVVENRDSNILVNNLYNKVVIWNLPQKWAEDLFTSTLRYYIYVREGDETKLTYAEIAQGNAFSDFKEYKYNSVPKQLRNEPRPNPQRGSNRFFR